MDKTFSLGIFARAARGLVYLNRAAAGHLLRDFVWCI